MADDERILAAARRGPITNARVASLLRVSRATAQRRLAALVDAGRLARVGAGRGASYVEAGRTRRWKRNGLAEDVAWSELAVDPTLAEFADAERAAITYCATEMINNSIDHSDATWVEAGVRPIAGGVELVVSDDGIGAFERVRSHQKLASHDDAIVQLEKGKLTTMPARHTGEGIFFTSKVAQRFRLVSADRAWVVDNVVGDTGIGEVDPPLRGTRVEMTFLRGRVPALPDVFARWTDPDTMAFAKTKTTVKLAALGRQLMSRSEAKRVAAGLEKFAHVVLDFHGVDVVGQGFVDEIFRVFATAHPGIALAPARMNDAVAFMVRRARG